MATLFPFALVALAMSGYMNVVSFFLPVVIYPICIGTLLITFIEK